MRYEGRYKIFDPAGIKTYPLKERANKVKLKDMIEPGDIKALPADLPAETVERIELVAEKIVSSRKEDKPVVFFTGAHLIKNGLGPVLCDLVNRDVVTLVAGNGATAIHDFELALAGETSEDVPQALEKGDFGMAQEFSYINAAISLGEKYNLGFGESLGRVICDEDFRGEAAEQLADNKPPCRMNFLHPEISVLAACYEKKIPFTVHVGIGTDVTDQHDSFDGKAKGGCSGRDFLIFTNEISKLTAGGVVLNVGSAVTGPEVLLKAVSMSSNAGYVPYGMFMADFDLRPYNPQQMADEAATGYYYRDQKSVVTRIPRSFGGEGMYIQGNQKRTIPYLYKCIISRFSYT